MSNINTISEFLLHAGTDYRVFDMSRGIRKLTSQEFIDIENGITPAPFPKQQHGWFGILFFNKSASKEHYIWFVKLPIDEQGLIIAAGRQQFLQIVVEALGQNLDNTKNPNNQLPENPFSFVPLQQQLADFNSICRLSLALPLSKYFVKTKDYIESPQQHEWQTIPLQGISDFVASLHESSNRRILIKQFCCLADEMKHAICTSLENHSVNNDISSLLLTWYQEDKNDSKRLHSTIRALSQCTDDEISKTLVDSVLNSRLGPESSTLMLVAARHWKSLNDETILSRFIGLLAACDNEFFAGLYSDLVQIPGIRQKMLGVLRKPEKSPELTQAIGYLFGQTQS